MEIKKVGVIGAGVMGIGVGQSLAQSGMEAVLVDVSQEVLDRAKAEIRKNLRFQGMFQKGAKKEDSATVLGRIRFTTSLEDLGDVDFVVEHVPEKWELKREVYPRLDAVCPERAGGTVGQRVGTGEQNQRAGGVGREQAAVLERLEV